MELHISITSLILTALLIIFVQIPDVLGIECYSCVYIPGTSYSQSSCSEPWPWYRNAFGDMAKPPTEHCPHACVKIVIDQGKGSPPTVVRQCGWNCNTTTTQTTTTSCC